MLIHFRHRGDSLVWHLDFVPRLSDWFMHSATVFGQNQYALHNAANRSGTDELLVTACPQFACRTLAAAVTPFVQCTTLAEIAGMRIRADQIDQLLSAQLPRKPPSGCLVDPHQGCFELESRCHAEIE